MPTVQLVLFLAGTAALVAASWQSLRRPRSHGFWRFFAWESILILFVLQVERWFVEPFAWHQLISWALLLLSGALVVEGVRLLKVAGRPERGTARPGEYALEATTRLVTVGLYRYIRHPLYASLLALAWGIFFKDPALLPLLPALLATACLAATARADEREMLEKFGDEYAAYMRTTRMFVPFLF
jgi:protein-S-isoprenylcysteine O-methyltransferase Ste14